MTVEVLLFEMIKRISIAVVLGLIVSQMRFFDRLIAHKLSTKDSTIFIIIFAGIAIAGTYAGIPIDDALANSRMVGIMAAGLIAGPRIGGIVGLLAGIHRYSLGGFTALACAISSILEGLLAGIIYRYSPRPPIPAGWAFLIGCIGELLQMTIILLVATPFALAYHLVSEIALPMTIANSIGLSLFIKIIKDSMHRREILKASQSQSLLAIARQSVSYLRQGLTPDTATAVVKIIKKHTAYAAVSVTDTERVLAYIGAEANHHGPERPHPLTSVTVESLRTGKIHIAYNHDEIGCNVPHCTLQSALVVPLTIKDTIIGSLKLYYTEPSRIPDASDIAFAQGLADLFSTQLELTEIDRQAKLTEEAKMQALHTQINPHFLFNTLNTISSLIRTNPEAARRLLIKFSQLFRFTLQYTGRIISFQKEWEQVSAFLEIAVARHGDRLFVTHTIDPTLFSYGIPSLTLQPIIENAIKHGLQPREEGGSISILGAVDGDDMVITVIDDGVGFDNDPTYYLEHPPEGHIGISNVHKRLQGIYGKKYGLSITSEPEEGTQITIRLPRELPEEATRRHISTI